LVTVLTVFTLDIAFQ